jgi:hypothetical protein
MEDVRRCVSKRANELDGRDESVIEKEVQKNTLCPRHMPPRAVHRPVYPPCFCSDLIPDHTNRRERKNDKKGTRITHGTQNIGN